jgi:hypothetical protein
VVATISIIFIVAFCVVAAIAAAGAPASGGAVGGVSPIAMSESEPRVCDRSWISPDVFHRRASMAGEFEAVPIPARMFSKWARQPSRAECKCRSRDRCAGLWGG